MSKLVLALIVSLFAVGLVSLAFHGAPKPTQLSEQQIGELEAEMPKEGTVVRALKDVPEGATFTEGSITEETISQNLIPSKSATSLNECIGRKSRFGVEAGRLLSKWDLDPTPATWGKFYTATRDIKAGERLGSADFRSDYEFIGEKHPCFPPDIFSVWNRRARHNVNKGSFILDRDLD